MLHSLSIARDRGINLETRLLPFFFELNSGYTCRRSSPIPSFPFNRSSLPKRARIQFIGVNCRCLIASSFLHSSSIAVSFSSRAFVLPPSKRLFLACDQSPLKYHLAQQGATRTGICLVQPHVSPANTTGPGLPSYQSFQLHQRCFIILDGSTRWLETFCINVWRKLIARTYVHLDRRPYKKCVDLRSIKMEISDWR